MRVLGFRLVQGLGTQAVGLLGRGEGLGYLGYRVLPQCEDVIRRRPQVDRMARNLQHFSAMSASQTIAYVALTLDL